MDTKRNRGVVDRCKGGVGVLLLLALLFVLGSPVHQAMAAQAQQPEVLVYEEDFEDGQAQGWRLESEGDGEVGWVVEEGMLRGQDHFWAVFERERWLDSHLQVIATLGNPFAPEVGSGGLHIILRLSETGRYYVALHSFEVSLTKQLGFGEGEEFIPLQRLDWEVAPGIPHVVDLSAYGGQITVLLDGEVVVDVQDPEPLPPGTIALETIPGAYARVEEVRVYAPPAVPQIRGIEPQRVGQGEEVMLAISGVQFLPGARVEIVGEGMRVDPAEFVDAQHLQVRLSVQEDAPPGWREVVVTNPDGQAAVSPQALEVVEIAGPAPNVPTPSPSSPTPTPPPSTDTGGGDPLVHLLWGGGSLVLAAAGFALGQSVALKSKISWTEKARLQWHVEAEKKLPEPKKACQWGCTGKVSADLWDRWRVEALALIPLEPKGRQIAARRVTGEVLRPLDDLANWARLLVGGDDEEIHRQLAPVVEALLAEIQAWEAEGQTPPSIRLDAELQAAIKAQFGLHHCHSTAQGLAWSKKPLLKWTRTLNQPGGECLGVLRGPTAGEPDFAARARRELESCLRELIGVVRLRP